MNHNTDFYELIWLKLKALLHQLDQTIEMLVQQTIDDLEETYQQD